MATLSVHFSVSCPLKALKVLPPASLKTRGFCICFEGVITGRCLLSSVTLLVSFESSFGDASSRTALSSPEPYLMTVICLSLQLLRLQDPERWFCSRAAWSFLERLSEALTQFLYVNNTSLDTKSHVLFLSFFSFPHRMLNNI